MRKQRKLGIKRPSSGNAPHQEVSQIQSRTIIFLSWGWSPYVSYWTTRTNHHLDEKKIAFPQL